MITQKQQRFVEEFLVDLNAIQAAIRAGYCKRTAYSIGHENLRKPEIAAVARDRQGELAQDSRTTQQMAITGLHAEANCHGGGTTHSACVSAWGLGKHLGRLVNRNVVGLTCKSSFDREAAKGYITLSQMAGALVRRLVGGADPLPADSQHRLP